MCLEHKRNQYKYRAGNMLVSEHNPFLKFACATEFCVEKTLSACFFDRVAIELEVCDSLSIITVMAEFRYFLPEPARSNGQFVLQ